MARKQWVDPRKTRRCCWIKGCDQFGQWVVEPEPYRAGSHYDRVHAGDPRAVSATVAEIEAHKRARSLRVAS